MSIDIFKQLYLIKPILD